MSERMLRLPYFTRFSRLRQGQWMGRSIQEMKFFHHPRNFIQTLLKSRPSSISTPYRDQQRWVSTKKTAKKAHQIKSDELSGVDNYVGLLEYLRKDHVLELETHQFGMFRVGSSSWRPDIKVKQALERKLSVLPASQLLEMPAKDRSEILGYLNLLKFSNLSFVGKVKEWLMKVKRMHEEQRIGSDEGRVLVFHLLWIVPPHTLKQELEELSKSDLIQKKDFQSLVEYSNYLSLLRKLSHLLRVNLKDDFSDLLKFQDELNELPVLELLRFFKFHISTLRQEINNQTKELIASSMRKILSSNLILSNSDILSIMDIREALGILFDNEEALDFLRYVRDMQAMKRMVKLVKPLNSFQLCDDERASIFKEKINASITAAFWEGSLADRDFSTFIKIVDSAFLTPSSLILIKNADKEVKDISGDDQEVIVSTIPSYLQRDQIEATGLSGLSKALEFNVTINDFTESTKALFVQLLVNDVQKKDSPTNTSQVLVLLYKLQYKWSDLTRRAQERLTYFLTSPSNSFSIDDEISKSLMHYLPILCFDSEQATNTSLNLPLMKVNICLLRGISKKYQDSSASFSVGLYIKWLQTLPLAVQKLLLSSSGIRQFPKIKMDSPPLNVKQSEFINGCNKYLSQHLVQAQDMKDRKIMISDVNTPVKSFPMHLTVECNGKVIACIQLLKERIKLRGGEIKMDREDVFRDYLCYHTYGNVPIIHIELEDYSKLEVGEDVFKEIENVVRSLIQ